ncbi:sugar ABC transporter permease [Halolamina sp. CBA1230]|uniref:carbohydrate ABC transporter permease n=1 Tax=Halolamina sp. CBA1230 TaxID=1853690 RepID=UPI0009A17ACE|nr:sugar ABC transporter permease [Halolamina sp. CBA1230]QKY19140.1 sugar ABC transporter permease [Halolamina sp. CBA1230]
MSAVSALQGRLGEFDEKRLLLLATFVPFTLFFVLVWGVPIGYALGMSLFSDPTGAAEFAGLANYAQVLSSEIFGKALLNSVLYALSSTLLSLALGLGLALVVNREIKGGNALRTMMIFPYLLPTLVVIFMWTFLLDPNVGAVNQFLLDYGLIQEPLSFFSSLQWAMPAVVVASVWKYGSFAFFILLARLQAIDPNLYERARVEGASTWQAFRDITAPQLRGAVLIIILVRGIWMFNKFDIIYLATSGGPLNATTTLPIRVYELAFFETDFAAATALAGIMFLLLASTAVVYFWAFKPEKEVTA